MMTKYSDKNSFKNDVEKNSTSILLNYSMDLGVNTANYLGVRNIHCLVNLFQTANTIQSSIVLS